MAMLTLESLLDPTYGMEGELYDDPNDYACEAFDLLAEISEISSNITTFEAARRIKAGKSKKKKVKVKKTKTTAKNARAMKKANKRAKVRKEDDDLTGGTGPGPTNTSSQGLTETDKEVDPEQLDDDTPVVVVEPVTEGAVITESTSVSFESYEIEGGVAEDEMVIFEDASIVALEEEKVKEQTSLWQKIKDLWNKFVDWVMSISRKIRNFFSGDKGLWERATKDGRLDEVLKSSEKVIKVRPYKANPYKYLEGMVMDVEWCCDVAPKIVDGTAMTTVVTSVPKEGFFNKLFKRTEMKTQEVSLSQDAYEGALKDFYQGMFGVDQIPAATEKKMSELASVMPKADMEGFLLKLPEKMDNVAKKFKSTKSSIESKLKTGPSNVDANSIREFMKMCAKGVSQMYKMYGVVRTDTRKILSAADVERGAADDNAKRNENK